MGVTGLDALECDAVLNCPAYTAGTFGQLMVLFSYYPLWMTLMFFGASWVRAELVLSLIGFALMADTGINWALRELIAQPVPTPGCGEQYGMPAAATQHSVVVCLLVLAMIVRWRLFVSLWALVLLYAFVGFATLSAVWIGLNSADQLLVGGAIGVLWAAVYAVVINWLLVPHIPRIARWPLVRWFGFRNTICAPRPLSWYRAMAVGNVFVPGVDDDDDGADAGSDGFDGAGSDGTDSD